MRELVSGAVAILTLAAVAVGCIRWLSRNENHDESEFRSSDGRYSIKMPTHTGRVRHETQNNNGIEMIVDGVNHGGDAYAVSYANFPPGTVYDFASYGRVAAQNAGANSCRMSGGAGSGGDDWRDFELFGAKVGNMSGRVIFVRNRLYVIIVVSTNATRTSPEVVKFIDSFALTDGPFPWTSFSSSQPNVASRPAAAPPSTTRTPVVRGGTVAPGRPAPPPVRPSLPSETILGGLSDPEFRDSAPPGGLLVGMDVGLKKFLDYDTVGTIRPLYLTGGKYTAGQMHGTNTERMTRSLAKAGYAVGALNVKSGGGLDGFYIIFMKIAGDRLDPTDTYMSEWFGGPGGGGPDKLGGDGTPVIGVIGKKNAKDVNGIGLIFR